MIVQRLASPRPTPFLLGGKLRWCDLEKVMRILIEFPHFWFFSSRLAFASQPGLKLQPIRTEGREGLGLPNGFEGVLRCLHKTRDTEWTFLV